VLKSSKLTSLKLKPPKLLITYLTSFPSALLITTPSTTGDFRASA
jgi:hypothetical protein